MPLQAEYAAEQLALSPRVPLVQQPGATNPVTPISIMEDAA